MLEMADDLRLARRYQARAEEIGTLAEKVSDAATRANLLQLVTAYTRAAKRARQSPGVRVGPTFAEIVAEEGNRAVGGGRSRF